MPKIINLKAIDVGDIPLLFEFFQSQAAIGIKVWKKNTTYTFSNTTEFSFQNDVFQRKSKHKPDEVRYEVISNKEELGSGSSGTVKLIKGTLKLDETSARFKKKNSHDQRRVVKIQQHRPERTPRSYVSQEYEYTELAIHCAVKQPVMDNPFDNCTSFLTMRKFDGQDLFDIIVANKLTSEQRIKLSKGLLQALKVQVEAYGLVHQDIKLENIKIDMLTLRINIMDYAYCIKAGEQDNSCRGTIAYVAPELISHMRAGKPLKASISSDIYSMGRVLALVWNVSPLLYDEKTRDEHTKVSPEEKLRDLFNGIRGLHRTVKSRIKDILMGMLSNNPKMRLSLDVAIRAFEQIPDTGTEPVPELDVLFADASSDLPTTTSTTGAGSLSVASAMGAFGLMPPPRDIGVDRSTLLESSHVLPTPT